MQLVSVSMREDRSVLRCLDRMFRVTLCWGCLTLNDELFSSGNKLRKKFSWCISQKPQMPCTKQKLQRCR
ncbi:hypothetical protein CsSME_00022111 [Camellia sinensis var. sinensis]